MLKAFKRGTFNQVIFPSNREHMHVSTNIEDCTKFSLMLYANVMQNMTDLVPKRADVCQISFTMMTPECGGRGLSSVQRRRSKGGPGAFRAADWRRGVWRKGLHSADRAR